ncbi:MAG: TonB-dependent receptor [Bacteroidales bacterium]|nr:TonB-dependent receptor [Bacteroidales bacterium]
MAALAQTGTIKGRIFNETNNESLPFANIYIQGTEISTISNAEGKFCISDVKTGFYRLNISSLGFESEISTEFHVITQKTTYVDIGMHEKSMKLDEVEVRASVFQKKEEAPVSLRRIGVSEIENSPGANRDIAKVIQNLPGVAAIPSANRNDLIIRGGASNEASFYLDGIEIPNINHFATQGASGGTNGIINADFLREVNYYSSGFPSSKANALSAVFDFRLKDGNKEKLKYRGSLGASEFAFTADGPVGNKTSFIASMRYSYLQLLFKSLRLPFLPSFSDCQLKVKSHINEKNQITIIGIGALDHNRLDANIKNPNDYQRYLLANLPQQNQWNYAIGGVWKHFRDNGWQTMVLSRNMLSNRAYKYKNNNEINGNLIQDYRSTESENKFRWENFIQTNIDTEIKYGISTGYVKYFNNTYQKVYITNAITEIDYESELNFLKYAGFFQATKKTFNNRLTLNLAYRISGNSYSSIMQNPLKQSSPQVSVSYLLNEKTSINAHIGRYYQLPPYTALGYRNRNGIQINRKNDIKYISADHYVVGWEYRPTKSSILSLEGFYKGYNNYPFSLKDSIALSHRAIDFGPIGAEEIVSTAKGRSYGLELLSQNRFRGNINFALSYTFAISEFKDKNGNYTSTAWENRHIFVVTATKQFENNWYFGLKWRFAGGLPYTDYDLYTSSFQAAWDLQNQPYLNYDRLSNKRFNPFHRLDIRLDKSFDLKKSNLKLYLDIQNVYNFKADARDVYTNLDSNGEPLINPENPNRYLLRKIRSNGSGTILPTIGVIFDF